MKALLIVRCSGCGLRIGVVPIDTADMPNELQEKINKVILAHRHDCQAYGATK